MKQQVVYIHGGTTFESSKEYISFLEKKEVSLERLEYFRDWKDNLAADLGEDYEIYNPRMPNGTNAKYSEWELWFKRIIPLFKNNVVLIGHSLGGIFLAKYLSENKVGRKIKAVILVAAPYDDEEGEPLTKFKIAGSLKKFAEQVGEIYLFQSKDDPIVPFTELGKYKKALPNAKLMILLKGGHFNEESFPELLKLLKSLS